MRKVVFVPAGCSSPAGKVVPRKPGGEIAGPSRNRPQDDDIPQAGNLTLNNPLGKHLRVFLPLRQAAAPKGRNPYDSTAAITHRITAAPDAGHSDRCRPSKTVFHGTLLPVSCHCHSFRLFIVVVHTSIVHYHRAAGVSSPSRRPSPVFPMPGGKTTAFPPRIVPHVGHLRQTGGLFKP